MSVTKPTLPAGVSFSIDELLEAVDGGNIHITDGSYADEAAIKTAFSDQTVAATTITTDYIPFGEFQEKPFSVKSDVKILKSYHRSREGRRTTSIELNLIGLSVEQKNWLEKELKKKVRTVAIISEDKATVAVFNGLKWAYNWSFEADEYCKVTIKTEFSGITEGKIVPIPCPEAV
jgi:hypothetical protein